MITTTPLVADVAKSSLVAWRLSYFINSFMHSSYLYSASSSPLLLRDAPDTARILYQNFTPKRSYVPAKAGVEPTTLWTKGLDSTNAPHTPQILCLLSTCFRVVEWCSSQSSREHYTPVFWGEIVLTKGSSDWSSAPWLKIASTIRFFTKSTLNAFSSIQMLAQETLLWDRPTLDVLGSPSMLKI